MKKKRKLLPLQNARGCIRVIKKKAALSLRNNPKFTGKVRKVKRGYRVYL